MPFQKRVKNTQKNGTILVRKGSNILEKQCTISEKGQNSSTKKWYNFRRGPNIVTRNGTISEKGRKSSTKMVPF